MTNSQLIELTLTISRVLLSLSLTILTLNFDFKYSQFPIYSFALGFGIPNLVIYYITVFYIQDTPERLDSFHNALFVLGATGTSGSFFILLSAKYYLISLGFLFGIFSTCIVTYIAKKKGVW